MPVFKVNKKYTKMLIFLTALFLPGGLITLALWNIYRIYKEKNTGPKKDAKDIQIQLRPQRV